MSVQRVSLLALLDPRLSESRPASIRLQDSLLETGTVLYTDHPVDRELVGHVFTLGQQFFSLPIEVKQRYEFPEQGRQRGYTSFGVEHAKDNPDRPDLKEFWHQGPQLPDGHRYYKDYGHNVLVKEVPEFFKALNLLHTAYSGVAHGHVLPTISVLLNKDREWLSRETKDGDDVLRLIRYLAQIHCQGMDGCEPAAEHQDIDLGTLIHARRGGGLVLTLKDGSKLTLETEGGELIFQTGDMLQAITGYAFPSITHMVKRQKDPTKETMSAPFFIHPNPEFTIEVLDGFKDQPRAGEVKRASSRRFLFKRLIEIGIHPGPNPYPF